jgi:hypothetical protein
MLTVSHIKPWFLNLEERGPLVLEVQGNTNFNPFDLFSNLFNPFSNMNINKNKTLR